MIISTKKASIFVILAFCVYCPVFAQNITPKPLLNLTYDEQQPLPGPEGELYFTVAFHPDNLARENDPGDVWFLADPLNEDNKGPAKIASLSTASYDLLTGFIDNDTALVYHNDYKGQQVLAKYHRQEGQTWNFVEVLNFPGFRVLGNHFSGRLHASGKMLIMAMNSYGSYGNEDLYISLKQEGEWSRPLNLGTTINTDHQELSPYLSDSGKKLYFASNGHGSISGKKIFMSERLDDSWTNWSKPVLLDLPETQGMDLYFVEESQNNSLYYTNTRTSDGYGNIFVINRDQISLIPDQEKEEPDVAIPADTLAAAAIQEERKQVIIADSLPPVPSDIEEAAEAEKLDLEEAIDLLEIGTVYQLENVSFRRGTADFSDSESLTYVEKLSTYLANHPVVKVSIEGHTDAYGNSNLNKDLSIRRAAAIRDILLDNGVEFERIQINGWGGTRPITSNQTPEGREKNRRVELVILEK